MALQLSGHRSFHETVVPWGIETGVSGIPVISAGS
jgi:hypothetical protein